MTTYATQLETEAHERAKYLLRRAAEKAPGSPLDDWLARLEDIHARNMAAAAEYHPQQSHGLVLTAAQVSDQAVFAVALTSAREAQESI